MKKSHKEDCYFYNLRDFEYFKISRELFDIEWENFYSENLLSYQDMNQENMKLPVLDQAVESLIVINLKNLSHFIFSNKSHKIIGRFSLRTQLKQ